MTTEVPRGESADDDSPAVELRAEAILLERAIGGWRGMIDSAVPTLAFVICYIASSSNLSLSVGIAIGAGVLIVILRLIRREPLLQVFFGFVSVVISAWFANFTGKAENFFVPGFLWNLGYGLAILLSIVIGWPILGVAMGVLTNEGAAWRKDPPLRRVYAAASWIWVGLFFGRLAVQVPLYWANAIGALGVVKIVMGVPLYVLAAFFTFRMLQPVWVAKRAARDQP